VTILEANVETKADYKKDDNTFVIGDYQQITVSRQRKEDLQVSIGSYYGTFEWDFRKRLSMPIVTSCMHRVNNVFLSF